MRTRYGLLLCALVHKVYTIIRKLHFETILIVTPPASLPQQSDNALIGINVALAVLMAFVVGACIPVIVCVYFRNRHSKKRIAER